jgi:hypothetical protein
LFLSFFPAALILRLQGPEEAENQQGNVLRLIQIHLATSSLEKIPPIVKTIRRKNESPIRVRQRRQLFIGAYDKTLSIAVMRVGDPNRSPLRIDRLCLVGSFRRCI